ncbi:hypothetical protein K493DRAFT_315324 [Basidiobolus meristosporus CBS 931.73]|uniref:Peptidase C51 domain-containing protein n=1 Tax=Basidiobolus meristosporus CBS 931.73 TaxID=1314790 RepID=A0A1Y1YB09_9FUNG|nr:hypothetical protein K493DRAFT_315324 [Basidiobolus meristosporus CBS 931.73]|eukprot:ORX94804.1 hypothetical protein K493DRAFT_315324 [Basidiobolus meristosporus CBS 931.73]
MVKFSTIVCLVAATLFSGANLVALAVPVESTTASVGAPAVNQTEPALAKSKFDAATKLYSCSRQFRFNNGQCTDWADARYYELTCWHTQWWGDARTWANKARQYNGWVVSNRPRVPSIIVIQPGYQGCGAPGHVAVVERINNDGSVYTSNWNYRWNGYGGVYKTSYGNFRPGNGVQFIWHQ